MAEYSIRRLLHDDHRPEFDCDDADLNEFLAIDSVLASQELLTVTYLVERDGLAVAFFSLSNDAVKKELIQQHDKSSYNRLVRKIPNRKRYSTLPAVKIGRLATAKELQGEGIGSDILDFLKDWFTEGNKTGCRFIIVDAYCNPKTIRFYEKNGFSFLLKSDEDQATRLMIFDLMTVRP
ncbi:GNAT family N-acetyltransferase [Methylomonas sp. SURF-1]|uniref:GNAT family N-acetyltransferase n=1 Tax=Methylomonas aurea TaxID=2952224 RepID=A0ABT1UE57_9GAMM|nr:GNAT family N-acetyltransferase [Methylomonas sp. SURF-1]MCQ8180512.1 GNAT family N-acetyltransferase [Methylomonas sp. SURF-1]